MKNFHALYKGSEALKELESLLFLNKDKKIETIYTDVKDFLKRIETNLERI